MKAVKLFPLMAFLFFTSVTKVWALAPVESLVLGDFREDYSENETDPLNYVFTKDMALSKSTLKTELALYRGFYEEGKNQVNYCKEPRRIMYASDWEKTQVKRSTMALIQYVGLDLTSRALPQYAKELEYTREEFGNLVENLVGNYCSTNLSVISKRELTNNMILKFEKENTFKLPSIEGNPFFPDNIETYLPPKKAREQEFLYTVKLFQALCSWGGNPSNPGLLVPILKNAPLMAFFGRQMGNLEIAWNNRSNALYLKDNPNTIQVWCDNLICRRVNQENFQKRFIYSIGGTNVSEDLKRLYCDDFRDTDYKPKESDYRLAKIMGSITFDEENFINSQFIALITGIPDFLLRQEKFSDGVDVMRASLDYTWSRWAKSASSSFNNDLFFEEPLLLEYVPFKNYYNPQGISPSLKVAFDVNLGEFDRSLERTGKIRTNFKIKVSHAFLKYYRRAHFDLEYYKNNDPVERARLINRFILQLNRDVNLAREKLIIPPWKGNLELILANILTSQIMETPEKSLNFDLPGEYAIDVEINYGPFALKYINHQFKVKENQSKNLPVTPK